MDGKNTIHLLEVKPDKHLRLYNVYLVQFPLSDRQTDTDGTTDRQTVVQNVETAAM